MRLPNVINAAATGTGTINIEGATTPGALSAASLVFGLNGRGTLNFNHSDASGNYQFSTPVSGPGQVNVNNSGTTLLTASNDYSGLTSVNAGVLRAGSASGLSTASDFVVASGGTLDIHSYSPTLNSLANAGTVTLQSGGSNAVLTVANHYAGNGGAVQLNTVLEAEDAASQRLVINGDSSGTTTLHIRNLGGAGAQTTGNGILVVQVDGASEGTFSLPAPGYVEAGEFQYALIQVDKHWYLQTVTRTETLVPEASVTCTPAELTDTENQVSTCTVVLDAPAASDLSLNLGVPAANPRYTTSCVSPMLIAANATQAACTITATPNTTADDGDVVAELSIAPPSVVDAYSVAGPAAQVLIKDAGATRPAPTPVPSLGALGLVSLASLMGVLGMRRTRRTCRTGQQMGRSA
ncbi:autotransporter-associated beta strand protein [Comamonas sp. BIGb0152]|uniref:autotransporter outer membrane beta-barrel domain-containing protein n=1 Tax=Comamonas sp. BIGb0152 TaxID=2940601 RepID=UPI0021678EA2|nr:autotransporter outer membrane beta-barrel domain-containing protein [Comamonas sp. BIGb0152]MCS4294967.1 autotransporter-associated beta strand protein [Comamonas sp. BIGb0152]